MEHSLSGKAGLVENAGILSQIKSGRVITAVIKEDRLPEYLSAGKDSGFQIEQIAVSGESFPLSVAKNSLQPEGVYSSLLTEVKGEGYVAVSIKKPETAKDHEPFWKNLENLDRNSNQNTAQSPSSSTAKT